MNQSTSSSTSGTTTNTTSTKTTSSKTSTFAPIRPTSDGVSNETTAGVVATLSSHCESYYIGCSHTWSADQMGLQFAVPYLAGGYRLCWCHSANCTLSDYVVEIGTMM